MKCQLLKYGIWVLLLLLLLTGCSKGSQMIIAEYDGGEITEREFDNYLGAMLFLGQEPNHLRENDEFKRDVLEQYIAIQLLSANVDKEEAAMQKKAAQEEFKLLKEQYLLSSTNQEWKQLLDQFDTNEKEIQSFLQQAKIAGEQLEKMIEDTDIEEEYERLKEAYVFDIIELSHILVATEAAEEGQEPLRSPEEAAAIAEEILTKINNGEDFAALAEMYSDDENTADDGGVLPAMSGSQLVPIFGQALLDLQVGEISEPIEMDYGYHIIRLDSRVTESLEELDEQMVRQLRSFVVNNKFADYIETELPTKNVQIHL